MAKKKEIKQIFENLEPESSEAHPNLNEAGKDQAEGSERAAEEVEKLAEEMSAEGQLAPEEPVEEPESHVQNMALEAGQSSKEQPETEPEDDEQDDLLDDVRKSLLEEEAQEEGKERKWWRFGKSSRKKSEPGPSTTPEEINLPILAAMQATEPEVEAASEPDEYQDQLDELIDMLADEEPDEQESAVVVYQTDPHTEPEPEAGPEKPPDIEELKKQAFQARQTDGENETEVRSIALEGEEEAFVEVESKSPDQLGERLNAVENALKPYQRSINFAFAFLGIVMAVVAAFLIYNAYQRSTAQSAPTPIPSDVPYPTMVGLPGGWQFTLGRGSLTADGSWNPSGAEWLQGTEVCRWVALPYSRQLEAVVRTLNPDDPIELGMSNNDKLVYNVYSIRQMSPAEMRELDSNKPCLLIVLAETNADKRWVLTALP
jgi:hypothetical protein